MLIQYDLTITIKGSVNVVPSEAGAKDAPETQIVPGKGNQLGDSFDQTVQKDSSLDKGGDEPEETGPGGRPPGVPSIGIVPIVINCFRSDPKTAALEQTGGKPKPE